MMAYRLNLHLPKMVKYCSSNNNAAAAQRVDTSILQSRVALGRKITVVDGESGRCKIIQ